MSSSTFSDTEKSIIKNMMLSKSYKDIARMIDKNVTDVAHYIVEITTGTSIITKQIILDNKVKKPVNKKPTKKQEEKLKKDFEREQKRLRLARDHAISSERQRRRNEPLFKTKVVDYSKMVSVRIDKRTIIQVAPGTDIEAVRRKYLKFKMLNTEL